LPDFLTDAEIDALLAEPKRLPEGFRDRLAVRQKRGHQEAELEVQGDEGSEFRVIVRRSSLNPLDFSVILAYVVPNSNRVIRLRRYNGRSHHHTNPSSERCSSGSTSTPPRSATRCQGAERTPSLSPVIDTRASKRLLTVSSRTVGSSSRLIIKRTCSVCEG
jgi:hypothetical protein